MLLLMLMMVMRERRKGRAPSGLPRRRGRCWEKEEGRRKEERVKKGC